MSSNAAGGYVLPRNVLRAAGYLAAIPIALLIVGAHPAIVMAGIGAIVLSLLVLRWPVIVGIAVVASVPLQQVGAVGPLTVTRALVVFAVAAMIIVILAQRRDIVLSWIVLPFGALTAWMSVSATRASDTSLATDEVLRWVIALVSFAILLQLLVGASERVLVGVVAAVGLMAALQAATGMLQAALALGPQSFTIGGQLSRAYGTFGRPNTFAGYLEMALFPVMWLGFHQLRLAWSSLGQYREVRLAGMRTSAVTRQLLLHDSVTAFILLGSATLIFVGILISFSRGAWLGVVFGLIVSFAIAIRRWWLPAVAAAPLVMLLAVMGVSTVAPAALTERVVSIAEDARPFDAASITITNENFAAVERMAHWQAGWDMFLDNPILGVGPGNYNVQYSDYYVRNQFRFSQGHAHNYYIHVLAETGVVGLGLYAALMLSALSLALRVAVKATGLPRALAMGAVGTTAAVMAHNVFENLHVLNLGIQLAATWALAIAAYRIMRSTTPANAAETELRKT